MNHKLKYNNTTYVFPPNDSNLIIHQDGSPTPTGIRLLFATTTNTHMPHMLALTEPLMLIELTICGQSDADPTTLSPEELIQQTKKNAGVSVAKAYILTDGEPSHELIHFICIRAAQLTVQEVAETKLQPDLFTNIQVQVYNKPNCLAAYYLIDDIENKTETILETRPIGFYHLYQKTSEHEPAIIGSFPPTLKTNLPKVKAALDFYHKLQTEIQNTQPPWEEQ